MLIAETAGLPTDARVSDEEFVFQLIKQERANRMAGENGKEAAREYGTDGRNEQPKRTTVTDGFMFRARKLICVPISLYDGSAECERRLYDACRDALDEAKRNLLNSVTFPELGTETHGFPAETACRILCRAVKDWIEENRDTYAVDVLFCVGSEERLDLYRNALSLNGL